MNRWEVEAKNRDISQGIEDIRTLFQDPALLKQYEDILRNGSAHKENSDPYDEWVIFVRYSGLPFGE